MHQLIFKGARIFDGNQADCPEGMFVHIADGRIQEVSAQPINAKDAQVIDVGGRMLMPGMIDAHVHAFASDVAVQRIEALGEAYRTAHAARMLGHALNCGFTTVRDIGGGKYSLYRALADGLLLGPRYLYSGKVLSMTGGHGDFRSLEERPRYQAICACGGTGGRRRPAKGHFAACRRRPASPRDRASGRRGQKRTALICVGLKDALEYCRLGSATNAGKSGAGSG